VGLRVFFKTETIKLQEVFFDAGEVAAGHAHKEDQAGYIVSGRFEFTLDGTPHELGAGDAYLIPGGVSHAVKGLETGSYVLFSALSSKNPTTMMIPARTVASSTPASGAVSISASLERAGHLQ